MKLYELGFDSYEQYIASTYFERLRKMVGVRIKKCKRCKIELVRLPHHLTYETLGEERKNDVVGVCFFCNDLATFYDDGTKVPLTEYHMRKRWKEICSFRYKIGRLRPSDVLYWLWDNYKT